jgi:hypothetical protein
VLLRSAFLLVLLLSGCPKDNPQTGCSGFVGSTSAGPEVEVVVRGVDGTVEAPAPNGDVPMIFPPQGGRIILIGVRAKNMDTCGAQLTGALRDPCTGRVLGLEGRPVDLILDENGDGWASPATPMQLNNFANVAVCPNNVSSRNLEDEPYKVEVSLTDREGRTAASSLPVVPRCAEPENEADCRCICGEGYVLGTPCGDTPDAGAPPGTCPADAGSN